MTRIRTILSFAPALLLATPALALDLIPKQLAGPPSEFAAMAPATAASGTLVSKSALIPIELSPVAKGMAAWKGRLPIEGDAVRMLVLGQNGEQLDLALQAPGAKAAVNAAALAAKAGRTAYGLGDDAYQADYYDLQALQAGSWNASVSATSGATRRGFILMEAGGPQRLESAQGALNQTKGQRITLTARLVAVDAVGAPDPARAGQMQQARMAVTAPDGSTLDVAMFDDGLHGDGAAGDGLYGAAFEASKAGNWNVQVIGEGIAPEGHGFIRTAEHLIPVVDADLALSARAATAVLADEGRLSLRLPVETTKADQHYRAYAEVWGTGKDGHSVPVAWVAGMSAVREGALNLGLDARWIAAAGAQAPFELRKVRIEDPDHFVTVASTDRAALQVPRLPTLAKRGFAGVIDESMLMGQRPAELAQPHLAKGVGTKLLLVHGYCSGNVWNTSQFSNSALFQDLKQNRTHDQFAQRIKTFGNTWNSYGVVAHSQGGAASLHLYAHYWSGLDNATGPRLIQSVGTPYQGTALAGNLAAIGAIFGAGCGSNANLTYSGASSWLATIPTWARNKVHYYTTSFTDRAWVYDYCHLASDVVLSDPDDGTTERAYGQLSGAVNQGHKEGWCHTTGMRDPAQYNDTSRNSTMSSQAAR